MSKAILVMDMPSSCDKCPLFGSHYSDMTCRANGRSIDYPYPKENRQDWCPLRELPQKHTIHCIDTTHHRHVKQGWNYCIDTILKGGAE